MNEYISTHNLEQINLSLSIDYTLYNVKSNKHYDSSVSFLFCTYVAILDANQELNISL